MPVELREQLYHFINNSKLILSCLLYFKVFIFSYEERARSLETVMTKHKDSTTYEDFIARVYSPVAMPSPFCHPVINTSGSGDGPQCSANTSMLAAALLDSHGHSHKVGPNSDAKFRSIIFFLF